MIDKTNYQRLILRMVFVIRSMCVISGLNYYWRSLVGIGNAGRTKRGVLESISDGNSVRVFLFQEFAFASALTSILILLRMTNAFMIVKVAAVT